MEVGSMGTAGLVKNVQRVKKFGVTILYELSILSNFEIDWVDRLNKSLGIS